ncbi:NADP-dependent oxidoreductase [Amycolatopsis benzoatilytica]|uniref:NADP-dependent oxidoreductase n=1 Tax=Amycolatopsis benzoatilytica TaxID=346045 RepID=UPI00035DEBD5|nr:NADP-dependent oxidoreductase [Amycolatopsis benzoatilytica]
MSRAVVFEKFGGPEELELREVPEPHAGAGQVRVRVAAAGLNPMDWGLLSRPGAAAMFGLALPSGFGYDFAGVVDEIGDGVTKYAVGDRVHGGALGRAVADFVVLGENPGAAEALWRTPDGVDDETAAVLPVAGMTAAAVLSAVDLAAGDTVLVGAAAGGVGVFAVQLAKLAGARVLGTASPGTFEFLRELGAEPVEYGPGLADRVRAQGITAAIDLFGAETAEAAVAVGVPPKRIASIVAGTKLPDGVRSTGGADAPEGSMKRIHDALVAGDLVVPIAATFPVEQIRDAVSVLAGRHVHGKVVVLL